MRTARIAIVGDGVAGLYAARLLDRFDLGPTWFWPVYQRKLERLIDSLGLNCFVQHANIANWPTVFDRFLASFSQGRCLLAGGQS